MLVTVHCTVEGLTVPINNEEGEGSEYIINRVGTTQIVYSLIVNSSSILTSILFFQFLFIRFVFLVRDMFE